MYVITTRLSSRKIEGAVNQLCDKGYYQTYYEVPLDIVTDDNGYDFIEKKNETTELNIYINTYDESKELSQLADILDIDELNLEVKRLEQKNYQQTFEDIVLENGWVITTPSRMNLYDKEKRIILESQGNFGTGYHETTRDCLNFILKRDFNGMSVADIGAGSGVLSLAAAIKGATIIDTYDIQPVKREVLYQCELNDVNEVNVFQDDLIKNKNRIKKKYDWFFINIGTQENIDVLNSQRLLEYKDTKFLVSGMLELNAQRVEDLFIEAGFLLEEKKQTNEWVTCIF